AATVLGMTLVSELAQRGLQRGFGVGDGGAHDVIPSARPSFLICLTTRSCVSRSSGSAIAGASRMDAGASASQFTKLLMAMARNPALAARRFAEVRRRPPLALPASRRRSAVLSFFVTVALPSTAGRHTGPRLGRPIWRVARKRFYCAFDLSKQFDFRARCKS